MPNYILDRLRMAATQRQPLDPRLICEIKEAKEELANHGYVYLDGYERPFRLVPAIRKCSRCGFRSTGD
jgi:hypothetical protein